jgi:type IV secretory pathway TrbD component
MTIGSGPTTPFYIAVGLGSAFMLYMFGAAIDTQVNKNARRAVILAGISVMVIILSGLAVAGVEYGVNPIVLAIFGLAIVIPTIVTIVSNKKLYDAGYVELPVFKGLATSMFSVNIVYLIYLVVAIGILYGKQGLTLDTFGYTNSTVFIIIALLIQIIIHGVFTGKCSEPDYNCVPTIKTNLSGEDLTYEQSCQLKTSNNMNLRASRIVLGVVGFIILITNMLPLIKSIKLTMANNGDPVYYIPAALACVAAILSYMNIWERGSMV